MDRDRLLRTALWATTAFNAGAAMAFLFPESLGQLAGLPVPAPPIYTTLLAGFVILFGGAYAWLAWQPVIDRPLLTLSAIGKAGVFVTTLSFWLFEAASPRALLVASGDLIFAAIFAWWLLTTRRSAAPRSANEESGGP